MLLLFVVGLFALELPLGFLAPAAYREFALGALVATAIWAVVHLVVIGSGTAPLMMGDTGEQWTASELRKLRRDHWRALHHARLKRLGDIDHIAIGPGGVVVLETKWRRSAWDDSDDAIRIIRDAIDQARRHRRSVWLTSKSKVPDVAVRAVVTLWSAAPREAHRLPVVAPDPDVAVVLGRDLRGWMEGLDPSNLDADQIEVISEWLTTQVVGRDRWELQRSGPPPRGLEELLLAAGEYVVGFAGGVYAGGSMLAWLNLYGFLPIALAALGAVWMLWRGRRVRLLRGWLAGTVVVVVAIAVVFARSVIG